VTNTTNTINTISPNDPIKAASTKTPTLAIPTRKSRRW